MMKPFTCNDEACDERKAKGKRCPWCWGGFPLDGTEADELFGEKVGPIEAGIERLCDEQLERAAFFARLRIWEASDCSA